MGGENGNNGLSAVVHDSEKYKPLHKEEEPLQQEQQRAAAPIEAAPVAVQREAAPLETNIHRLRDEEFVELNLPLVHADPVFRRGESSLFRQRNQGHAPSGKKARQRAAQQQEAEQKAMDKERFAMLNTQITGMRDNQEPDVIVKRTILGEEAGHYQHQLSERKDVNGVERRRNESRYARVTLFAHSAAKEDVKNLVENLRRDLCLEGESKIPENMREYTDAYYFVSKYGNEIAKEITIELRQMKGTISEEEYKARHLQMDKLEDFKMIQKSYASNFTPTMIMKAQDIRARKLAKQQIQEEGSSAYHQMMIRILDQEISELETEYDNLVHWMETYSDTMDTTRSRAQADMQKELARIRREMKKCDEPVENETAEDVAKRQRMRDSLEQEGRALLKGFNYEGPRVVVALKKLGEQ